MFAYCTTRSGAQYENEIKDVHELGERSVNE